MIEKFVVDALVPDRPLRRRRHGIERFTVTRGGEYAVLPRLIALHRITGRR